MRHCAKFCADRSNCCGDMAVFDFSRWRPTAHPVTEQAESYVNAAAREACTAAEIAASRKEAKYADIDSRFVFEPIAAETLGVLNSSARLLLSDIGRRITNIAGEARELSFLFNEF